MKLGVWQRLAVVLTIAWLIGATGYGFIRSMNRYDELSNSIFQDCRKELGFAPGSAQQCLGRGDEFLGGFQAGEALAGSFGLALLLPLSLVLIFGILWLPTKWILAGRRTDLKGN
jgi:hypothetical protein